MYNTVISPNVISPKSVKYFEAGYCQKCLNEVFVDLTNPLFLTLGIKTQGSIDLIRCFTKSYLVAFRWKHCCVISIVLHVIQYYHFHVYFMNISVIQACLKSAQHVVWLKAV